MEEPFCNIFQEFGKIAQKYPARKSILFRQRQKYQSLSYDELYKQAIRLGNLLCARGIRPLDKVAILLGNRPEWPISFFATQYIGATAVPLDVNLFPTDTSRLLAHSESKALLCSEKNFDALRRHVSDFGNAEILLLDSPDFLDELKSSSSETVNEYKKTSPGDIAAMFYTSGTTRIPKAVMLSQRNLLSNVESIKKFNAISEKDILISLLPLHHTYSFMGTCLFPLLQGAQIAYPSRLTSRDILDCMKHANVSILIGVPQLFLLFHKEIEKRLKKPPFFVSFFLNLCLEVLRLIRNCFGINLAKYFLPQLHRTFGGNLRYMVSGGASLEPKVIRDFFKWGFTILEGYGLTETSPIVTINPPQRQKIGSVGKPVSGVEIKILDPKEGGVGEVAIKGPNVMAGYYKLPQETGNVLKDGWFLSGDLGQVDKDGYLYIKGRKDEMLVLSSGENINPEEVENHYNQSPYIKEICVFTSKGTGYFKQANQLVAVIVPDEEYFRKHKQINIDEKIKWELDRLSYQLNNYKRIKGFVISKERLARTTLGKIVRYRIEEEYSKKKPAAPKREGALNEDDLMLLSSTVCQNALRHLSDRLKKKVTLNDHFEIDLGIDSLGRIELLLELQDILKIQVPESEMEDFFYSNTIKELFLKAKPYLSKKVSESKEGTYQWSDILAKDPPPDVLKTMKIKPSLIDKLATGAFLIFLKILCGILFRIEARGKNNLPPKGPVIIYANHNSYLDGFMIAACLPLRLLTNTFFLGFRAVFMHPLAKNMVKIGRLVPISITFNLVDVLQACAYLLRHSKCLCYFPEGQRSPDGTVIKFKKGIGILAQELKAPSIPTYIQGAFEVWGRHLRFPRPHKVIVTFGRPITHSDLLSLVKDKECDYDEISETLREQLINLKGPSSR